jgi:hypothetical protein
MNIPFLGNWRKSHGATALGGAVVTAGESGASGDSGREGIAALLAECELLRAQAERAGVELDDTAASLTALDQLVPRWRDDEELLPWLGNDAGLYLGTVIVRTVPGAVWELRSGHPVVLLATGREIDVVTDGQDWAVTGAPELSQVYAEVA